MISALQVEKHPLVTPGPLAASPSAAAARLSRGAVGVYSALAIAKGVAPSTEYCLPFTTTPNSKRIFIIEYVIVLDISPLFS